jgi:hypothetical protein
LTPSFGSPKFTGYIGKKRRTRFAPVAAAASQFLLRNDYVSLFAELRDMPVQEVWKQILADVGLPACDLPGFALVT